ncbi:hypothetical protein BKA82DRAFT_26124 [Pisolithus tinctorius]|uniref:Uncharacterized protein n=1 Tax=Pisolithus tinctorius Marx 270 TaxID=870435 RepID=A0A0C3P9W1_PISTI|nr:hypothetical protein BKA82DRAFT_26124 [Pisolithus tinctorius]KIO04666.1 hypothetical protein M404DRAFT_26124 [Pisolithus tinctorius Marx 270]
MRDLSVYYKDSVEGTRAVVDAAIAAGIYRLVYTRSATILFDAYNDAQEAFGPGYSQVISNNHILFDYTYIRNIMCVHLLTGDKLVPPTSCSSTILSKPALDPESVTTMPSEPLHHTLPPICAKTEYHCGLHSSAQPLSPYVTSLFNIEPILSAFNTPFDPHELEHPVICS